MKSYTVLCVDDVENNLFTLEQLLLNLENVEVLKALSGREALNILLESSVDLILLDIQMPEMDGYEVAKLLKSNKLTHDIPVIFLTAVFKSEEFVSHGYEVGAIDYLTKPLDDNQLLNRISLYLRILKERDNALYMFREYENITESIHEGLYVLDEAGKVLYINRAACEALGYRADELLGKNIHNQIHYKDMNEQPIPVEACPFHQIFTHKESMTLETRFFKKDGNGIPVLTNASFINDTQNGARVIVIFQDISERIAHNQQILAFEQQKSAYHQEFIVSLANMIEKRDAYTAGHTERVATYCKIIATAMKFEPSEIEKLCEAAKLHDIGKISTPDSILLKPGTLDALEYTLIQDHLQVGYEILHSVEIYREAAELMRYHHERYDGKGYPQGAAGAAIPLLAHVMIVADSFDAMTTHRIYKSRKSLEEALDELKKERGKQFHPDVVDTARKVLTLVKSAEGVS